MAEKQQQQQQEPEITSEESNNPIDEDELELSLGIRPIHSHSRSSRTFQKLPAAAAPVFNNFLLSKRDAQAFRRQEAKKKRELKRQASNIKREENEVDVVKRCRFDDSKLNASYWGPPSWWSWTPAGAGFRPYQGHNGKIVTDGQNGEGNNNSNKDGEIIQQSLSTGSSSGVSDNYQSNSCPGGNNSDAGSHSSHPHSQLLPSNDTTASVLQTKPGSSQAQPQPNSSSPNLSLPQLCSSSSNQIESTTSSLRQSSNSPEGATSSNAISNQDKVTTSPPRSPSPKEAKREMGKPPKPNGQMNQERLAVSQMPCVSTTGNGPNGKTITGFLYRYTKAEVSIVCVCHGASFSPAGFVEHAGGVDIVHPLRHIRVVPFAL